MKRKILFILSFTIPILIFLLIATITNFLPFGKKMLIIYDVYFEYSPFLAELGDILRNGKSIFYTLRGGMGVNFYSILNLYCGSPLNLLTVFFKRENIYIFYTLMIYLKIGLAGLTMYIYLNSLKTKYKDTIWNLVFSSIYALSGYVLAFNMHLMWMDAYIMLPLIIKGIDSLIIDNKHIYYVFMLAIMMVVNYYMAFKICIFLIIYFIYKTIVENKFNKKVIFKFIGYSCIAAGMAAVVLIPTYFNLVGGRFENVEKIKLFVDWRTLFSLPYNLTMGSFLKTDNFNYGTNTIFVTLFIIVLVVYFLFNKSIEKMNRISVGCVLLFYIVSFSISLIDYAWNLFQRPIWWSHRYQFTFIFFLIIVAYNSFLKIDEVKISKKVKSLMVIIFFCIFLGSFSYKILGYGLTDYYFLMFMVSVFLYFLYMFFMKKSKIFIILLFFELCINGIFTLQANPKLIFKTQKTHLENTINELKKIKDKNSYRLYTSSIAGEDAGFLIGFNSVELFSSSYNYIFKNFVEKTNFGGGSLNHIVANVNIPLGSLFGIKYYYGKSDFGYLDCSDKLCVDHNAMPFMYSVSENVRDFTLSDDCILNNNNIYSSILNKNIKIFEKPSKDIIKYNGFIDDGREEFKKDNKIGLEYVADKNVLVIFNSSVINVVESKIKINNEDIGEIDITKNLILNKGDVLNIDIDCSILENSEIEVKNLDNFTFMLVDLNLYSDTIKSLKESANYINLNAGNKILRGKIITGKDTVLLTIPYDDGLKITVDGKKVEYFKALDAFVSIEVDSGEHIVEVDFVPSGFSLGLVVSIITTVSFVFINIWQNKERLLKFNRKF